MSKGMMTTACSLVLLSICVASPNVLAVDETKEDIAKLQGNWRMVSWGSFKGGAVKRKAQASSKPDMIIKGNKIATPADNLELPFSLDVAKNPKQIKRNIRYALGDNKFKLVEYYSIYRFDGGRWMLCLFDYGPAQTGVPKAFPEPGKASEQEVIVEVFERLREEKKPFRGRQVVRRFIVPSQRW